MREDLFTWPRFAALGATDAEHIDYPAARFVTFDVRGNRVPRSSHQTFERAQSARPLQTEHQCRAKGKNVVTSKAFH